MQTAPLLLVSGASIDVAAADRARVGVLLTPSGTTRWALLGDRLWAVDSGAFTGFLPAAFLALLDRVRGRAGCVFVAAPDVVADAAATLRLFAFWEPVIRAHGFPVALVGQDGLTPRDVPWGRLEALFIGGSTDWKMGRGAETLLGYAAAFGKWRHVGRVNSRRRIRHFLGLCDSIDGSSHSKYPHKVARTVRWFQQLEQGPRLPHLDRYEW